MLHGENEKGQVPEHAHPGSLLEGRSLRPGEPGSPVWRQKVGGAAPFELIWEALCPPTPGRVLVLRDKASHLSCCGMGWQRAEGSSGTWEGIREESLL